MNKYEGQLQHFLEIRADDIESEAIDSGYLDIPLRYNRNRIVVSDLEDEYFCEAFLNCGYNFEDTSVAISKLPQIKQEETKRIINKMEGSADVGTKEHIAKERTTPHIRGQIVRGIFKDILIAGQTDEIQFNGKTIAVIDHKFKTNIPYRDPYNNHKTQVLAYAYCLQYMLSSHPQYSKLSYSLTVDYASTINHDTRTYSFPYNHQKITNELEFAYPFWKMQRDPVPTKDINKCRTCKYKFICTYSYFKGAK